MIGSVLRYHDTPRHPHNTSHQILEEEGANQFYKILEINNLQEERHIFEISEVSVTVALG